MNKNSIIVSIIFSIVLTASLVMGIYAILLLNNMKNINYDINVAGIEVTAQNANNILNGVSYDANNNILTLNNANLSGEDFGIKANKNLKIKLVGENVITLSATNKDATAINLSPYDFSYDLKMFGNGSLTINTAENTKANTGIVADDVSLDSAVYNININNALSSYGVVCNNFSAALTLIRINLGESEMAAGIYATGDIDVVSGAIGINIENTEFIASAMQTKNNINLLHSNIKINIGDGAIINAIEVENNLFIKGDEGEVGDVVNTNSILNYESKIIIETGNAELKNYAINVGNKLTQEGAFIQAITGNCSGMDNIAIYVQGLTFLNNGGLYAKSGSATSSSQALLCEGNLNINANHIMLYGGQAEESYGAAVYGHVYGLKGIVRCESNSATHTSTALYIKGTLESINTEFSCWAGEVSDVSGVSYGLWCYGLFENYGPIMFATGYTKAFKTELINYLENFKVYYADLAGDISETNISSIENPVNFDYDAYKYIFIENIDE